MSTKKCIFHIMAVAGFLIIGSILIAMRHHDVAAVIISIGGTWLVGESARAHLSGIMAQPPRDFSGLK